MHGENAGELIGETRFLGTSMKKLLLSLTLALPCIAQVELPPHQCISFILKQDNTAFSAMPIRPVFMTRIWVACLPKEGVRSYQIEVKSPNVNTTSILMKMDLQSIPGPQVTGSEWQEILFMAIPITFGPISEILVSEVQVLNSKPATLVQ